MQQLVPPHLLASADKILFIAHLAIGDFVYWQNYFAAFARQYPHIKIDVLVSEVRATRCFWRWPTLKKYALYDWLDACPWVNKLYRETYSPGALKKTIKQAQAQQYPIVISLATLRPHKYAHMSRTISHNAFIVGIAKKASFFCLGQKLAYKKLNACIKIDELVLGENYHITDLYAQMFEMFFGIVVEPQARAPFVKIPRKWVSFAKFRFLKWGIDKKTKEFGRILFINAFAKSHKRSWPLQRVEQLVTVLKQQDKWRDVSFIVNVMPEDLHTVHSYFNTHSVNDLYIFSANYNFFQLPAIISICDMVISVETSVMHLASALKVPVVALMRTKNPEWRPWDEQRSVVVHATNRQDWVKDITVDKVLEGMRRF